MSRRRREAQRRRSMPPAAELPIALGDNPERLYSDPAFAKLRGVAPQPTSSGVTTRHRLLRGGNRQANAALYRKAIVRMHHDPRTRDYVIRRASEGLSTRDRSLPQALHRPRRSRPVNGELRRTRSTLGPMMPT